MGKTPGTTTFLDPEKTESSSPPRSGTQTPITTASHSRHQSHQSAKIPRHFFRPDGRKVIISPNPHEAERLRRAYSDAGNEDSGFDIVIHGDEDHIAALRETHSHHEQAREQLRVKHGPDFDEFERVVRELDKLSAELHLVSEHAVQLDANFEKYGYSAHLRTRESPNASSLNLSHDGHEHQHVDWDAAKRQGEPIRFWVKPVIRQYFHKGLLWRAQEAQEVASYELFIDLLYVAIIAISGDNSAESANGTGLLRFAITFLLAWKYWSDISMFISWFDADDILRRITVLFVMTCLLGLTTNMSNAFDNTWKPLIAFYIASRWLGCLYFLWMAYLIPMVRPAMIGSSIASFIPSLLWIGSLYVEEPRREAIIWLALFLDIFGPTMLVAVERGGAWMGPWLSTLCRETFQFMPGNNIEHRIERTNAFVALVFGYSVVSLLYQSRVPFGINGFFGKAVLGLVQAFAFNWLYFEIDTFNMHVHAIRRHFVSAMVWLSFHLPFIMAFVLAGSALAKIVLAHDFPDADPANLLEPYATKSERDLRAGLRWYYCGGLAVALSSMGVIHLTHVFRTIPNQRIPKRWRLTVRFAASLAILLLPLAGDALDSMQLVATTTSIVVVVLAVELIGNSQADSVFWGFNSLEARKRRCTYSAKCGVSKRDLEASFKNGQVLKVEELAAKDGGRDLVKESYHI